MQLGVMLTDVPTSVSPRDHFANVQRLVDVAQRSGLTSVAIGQHFLYGDLRWLQPIPLLARLAADLGPDVRLVTNILVAPLFNPVVLAEEVATLDIVSGGRLSLGVGIGYRRDEFEAMGIPFSERAPRLDEMLELLPRLWTEESVDHDGRFWQLDGARPHIQPLQEPYPPLWVGGTTIVGARRAGRAGDAYLANPEADMLELAERYAAVEAGFAARNRAMSPQPLRRNIRVAASKEQALREYVAAAQPRYQTYRERENEILSEGQVDSDFATTSMQHAIIGTPEDCVAQLAEYARRLPVGPVLLKPQWSYTTVDDACEQMEWWGRELVPALADVGATTSIDPALLNPKNTEDIA